MKLSRLNAVMEKDKIRVEVIAAKAKISARTVGYAKVGKDIKDGTALKIAHALKMKLEDLV